MPHFVQAARLHDHSLNALDELKRKLRRSRKMRMSDVSGAFTLLALVPWLYQFTNGKLLQEATYSSLSYSLTSNKGTSNKRTCMHFTHKGSHYKRPHYKRQKSAGWGMFQPKLQSNIQAVWLAPARLSEVISCCTKSRGLVEGNPHMLSLAAVPASTLSSQCLYERRHPKSTAT